MQGICILGKPVAIGQIAQKTQHAQCNSRFEALLPLPGHAAPSNVRAAASTSAYPEPAARPGYHQCPVCKRAVVGDNQKINLHLGEPLFLGFGWVMFGDHMVCIQ